jgi:hypothetical protein
MRSAAVRAFCLVVLALGGVSSGAAMAGVQLDPIGTVTSAISTITSQTTVVSDLTDSTISGGSGATDALSGATDAISGSGVLSGSGTTNATSSADGGTGSASSGDAATASNRGSPHTRFDRLPRRYERLLERIESGRDVRANIARLRALLASASPQLRARVVRLIRLEIRRLERGGLTRRERAAVQRLRTLLTTLQGQPLRPATQGPLSLERVEGSGIPSATASAGGVEAATAGSESGLAGRPPTSVRDGASNATPRLPLPLLPPPSGPRYLPLLLLVLAAIACLLLLLTGQPRHLSRHLLPSPVRGIVEVRRPEVLALALVIGLGLVVGLVAVLLVQAVLLLL